MKIEVMESNYTKYYDVSVDGEMYYVTEMYDSNSDDSSYDINKLGEGEVTEEIYEAIVNHLEYL